MRQKRTTLPSTAEAEKMLADVFRRGGCFRTPNSKRRKSDGQSYKKGYKLRLSVSDDLELAQVRGCLNRLGVKPARPYNKHRQKIQVVYGKTSVAAVAESLARAGVMSSKMIDPETLS